MPTATACWRGRRAPALERGHALHWSYPVDLEQLRECAALLVGTHDFTAFTPTDTYHVRFERDVYAAYWRARDGDLLEFWIEADTFMRHMNRTLVGTMLEVARGRLSLEDFARLLEGAPRADGRADRAGARALLRRRRVRRRAPAERSRLAQSQTGPSARPQLGR